MPNMRNDVVVGSVHMEVPSGHNPIYTDPQHRKRVAARAASAGVLRVVDWDPGESPMWSKGRGVEPRRYRNHERVGTRGLFESARLLRESPRHCRDGNSGLKFQGVHQRNLQASAAMHTKGSFAMNEFESVNHPQWGVQLRWADAPLSQRGQVTFSVQSSTLHPPTETAGPGGPSLLEIACNPLPSIDSAA